MKKSNKTWVVLALLVLVLGVIGVSYSQSFAIVNEETYLPEYLTSECSARADNMAQIVIDSHTDMPTWYHCNSEEAKKYIPLVNGIQCEYQLDQFSALALYICEGFTENKKDLDDDSVCEKVTGKFSLGESTTPIYINAGDTIYIDTDKVFGDATLKAKYPSFGLRTRQADGFVRETTTNCLINSIGNDYHTINAEDRIEVIPDIPINVVSALQKAYSNQLVSLSGVEGGETIYISRPNYYFKVKEADDGFKYVDTTKEYSNKKIECIPRTTGCSDEAKIISLEEQSCDQYGGSLINYAPVEGDSTKLCKYTCSNGKLSISSDCIEVKKECPSETPLWDTTTGECVALLPPSDIKEPFNWIPLIILGVIALVGTMLVLIAKKVNKGKKGGRK